MCGKTEVILGILGGCGVHVGPKTARRFELIESTVLSDKNLNFDRIFFDRHSFLYHATKLPPLKS